MEVIRLQGYADLPDGQKNKRFTFSVVAGAWNDTFWRLLDRGYKFRAVWMVYQDGEVSRIADKTVQVLIDLYEQKDKEDHRWTNADGSPYDPVFDNRSAKQINETANKFRQIIPKHK